MKRMLAFNFTLFLILSVCSTLVLTAKAGESSLYKVLHVSVFKQNEVQKIIESVGVVNLFTITQVSVEEFNKGNPQDLSIYDVIIFGINDWGEVAGNRSKKYQRLGELEAYVKNGGGIIWTHDTLEQWWDYGVQIEDPAGVDNYDISDKNKERVWYSSVKIVNDHEILHNHFEIGNVGDTINIQYTHTNGGRVKTAKTIIKSYNGKYESQATSANDFYLTVNEYGMGRVAVIEIGHSTIREDTPSIINIPPDIESKIFVNTIFWTGSAHHVPPSRQKPIAIISAFPLKSDVERPIMFNASSSYDVDGLIYYYFFDFGDGTNSGWITESVIWKSYAIVGDYFTRVKVKDNEGLESDWSPSVTIKITNPPPSMSVLETKFYQKREGWRWPWEPEISKVNTASLTPGQKTTLQIEFANPPTSHAYIYISEDDLKSPIISDPKGIIDTSAGKGIKVYFKKYTSTPFSDAVEAVKKFTDIASAITTLIYGDIPYEYLVGELLEATGAPPNPLDIIPPEIVARCADRLLNDYNLKAATYFMWSINEEYGWEKGIILPPSSSIVFSIDVSAPQTDVETSITIKFDCRYIKTTAKGQESDFPEIYRLYLDTVAGFHPLDQKDTFTRVSRASATLTIKVETPWWQKILRVFGCSPINVQLIDPLGRRVGFNPDNNATIIEVPNATYSGPYSQPQIITIFNPIEGNYKIVIFGYDEGPYTIGIDTQTNSYQLIQSINKTSYVKNGEIHEITLKLEQTGEMQEITIPWWVKHRLWIIAGSIVTMVAVTTSFIIIKKKKIYSARIRKS